MIDAQMLAGMLSDSGSVEERLRSMIAERAANDQQFAALAQFVLPQSEPVRDVPQSQPVQRKPDFSHLRARIADMRDELIAQTQRNQLLAKALGACDSCWGTDTDCKHCRGSGVAGWRTPDVSLFQELVAPAFARLAADSAHHEQQEGNEP